MRMSITPLPYSLRADKPKLIMHMSLKPWRRHMKFPTAIQPTPSLASDMPLKGKQLVIYPCKTLWRAVSITHNDTPCIPQRVKTLMLWQKREKLDHIEERLRAIEGGEDYAFANLEGLLLVPNIITPPKFNVPDFDKYKGTTCPKNHLKMYYRKMGAYAKDEELLIDSFQESLTGVAVT